MSITIFSFAMSVLFSTIFIAAIHVLRNRDFFLRSFGVHTILFLYALCFFRALVVLELPFALPVGLRSAYSQAFEALWSARMQVDDASIRLPLVLCGVWLVVAATLILQFFWMNQKVAQKLSWCCGNPTSFAGGMLTRVKSESRRKLDVSLCVCPMLDVPMGIGVFQKQILLPDAAYTREETYYILKHEYAHFCNRDLLIKFLVRMFCCVFWWNPAVYLLKRDIAQILEIKCDMKATEGFSKKERLEYLLTIVRVLKGVDDPDRGASSILATGMICRKNGGDIRERFELMAREVRPVGRVCQGAFLSLAVTAVVLSYTFVLQSAFDSPVEDIFTDSSVQEIDTIGEYIVQEKSGKYTLVLATGEKVPISDKTVEVYASCGIEIKVEE